MKDKSERGLVEYPFPIRDDVTARLFLPYDLTKDECDRIYKLLLTLTTPQINEVNK